MRAIAIAMLALAVLLAALPSAAGALIEVDDDGGKDYTTIKAAVNNANPGDLIYVYDGNYYENLELTERFDFEGQSRDGVIVNGNQSDCVFKFASGSDGSTLTRMTVINASSASYTANVAVFSASRIVLEDLRLTRSAGDGLLFSEASDIMVTDCTISRNRGNGATLQDMSDNLTFVRTWFERNLAYGLYTYETASFHVNSSVFANNSGNQLYLGYGKAWLYNSSMWNAGNGSTDIYAYEGTVFGINLTYRYLMLGTGSNGEIILKNFLHVTVERSSTPVEGADVEVTSSWKGNQEKVYASGGYGGTDPTTDNEGSVTWVQATYAWVNFDYPDVQYNRTWLNVSFQAWEESRLVNMSKSHVEMFEFNGSEVIYVDASNAGDPSMDGSEDHPFDTITRALDNATDWGEIRVADGTYDEYFEIDLTVLIIGESTSAVVQNQFAVNITAGDVTLRTISFDSDQHGLRITVDETTLEGVEVTAPDTAVLAQGCQDLVIDSCTLTAGSKAIALDSVTNADLIDCRLEDFKMFGIDALDSDLQMSTLTLDPGTTVGGSASVRMDGSTADARNMTIVSGAADDIRLSGSTMYALNSSFDGEEVSVDAGSDLYVRYYLDIKVNRTSGDPVKGADLKVTEDGNPVYATVHYGGTDPQTGADGYVRWIVVESLAYEGSVSPTMRNVTVRAYYAPSEETAWEETRTLADLNASREEVFTYVPPPINYRPWTNVVIDEDEYSEDAVITYILGDREGQPCDINVMYSTNGTDFYYVTLTTGGHTLADVTSSKKGTSHTLSWDSFADLPDVDIDTVRIRLIANDTEKEQTNTSGTLHLDNDLNPPSVQIDPLSGELSGQVFVFFNLTDAEGNPCHIFVEYDHDGSTFQATLGMGGNTSSNMASSSTGWAYRLHWRSIDDLPGVDADITFRIIASDGDDDDDNGTADEITFHLDNNDVPDVRIQTPSGEKNLTVYVTFTLLDDESDKCTVEFLYKTSDMADFEPATVNLTDETPLSSSPSGVQHVIEWDSLADMGNVEDTDVQFRVIVSDLDTGKTDTETFHIDNDEDPPSVLSVTLPMVVFGDVNVVFVLADEQSAPTGVYIKFQIGAQSAQNVEFDSPWGSGNPLSGLTTSPEGEEYNFTWHTKDDIGKVNASDVKLILEPFDGPQLPDKGTPYETDTFTVRNHYYLPHIVELDVIGYRQDISIEYTLADLDGDDADLRVQYSVDGGENWAPATMAEAGDGKKDLSTSEEGVDHVFVWDSYADMPDTNIEDVIVRLQPFNSGETGPWNETEPFDLFNILNELPVTKDFEAIGDHGNITISIDVRDVDDDLVNITLKYRISASFLEATTWGAIDNITVSGSWKTVTFLWDSIADLGYNDHSVTLRIEVTDGISTVANETAVALKNGQIPVVTIDEVRTSDQGLPKGVAVADIVLKDFQSDDCSLEVEYSEDGGDTWDTATIDEAEGEPIDILSSSASGTDHSIAWNCSVDLGPGEWFDLLLRLRADDGEYVGPWAVSEAFDVDNGIPVNREPEFTEIPVGKVNRSEPMTIRIRVEDDSEDVVATIYYRMKGETAYRDEEMETDDDRNFTYTITAEEIGVSAAVQYYIEITDGEHTVTVASDGNPRTVTIERDEEPPKKEEETDMMPLLLAGVAVAGAAGGVGFFLFAKKKKGGKKGAGAAEGAAATGAYPPQPAGAQQPGAYGAPQAGAVTSVCPVCGAPVLVPPQRPVNVTCSRCRNTFHVK